MTRIKHHKIVDLLREMEAGDSYEFEELNVPYKTLRVTADRLGGKKSYRVSTKDGITTVVKL
jgi:hypothetical protein